MDAHAKRREESSLLRALEKGDAKIKGAHFEFRGQQVAKSDVKPLLQTVEGELEADAEWLKTFDREVFQTHLRLGQIINDGDQDLYGRYDFHLRLQDMLRAARQEEYRLAALFQFLSTKEGSLSKSDFEQVRSALAESHRNIQTAYEQTRSAVLPALQNMQTGQLLSDYLLDEPLISPLPPGDKIDGNWASALGRQISQIEDRCRRLYFKSMGAILTRQEAIAQNYRAAASAAAR